MDSRHTFSFSTRFRGGSSTRACACSRLYDGRRRNLWRDAIMKHSLRSVATTNYGGTSTFATRSSFATVGSARGLQADPGPTKTWTCTAARHVSCSCSTQPQWRWPALGSSSQHGDNMQRRPLVRGARRGRPGDRSASLNVRVVPLRPTAVAADCSAPAARGGGVELGDRRLRHRRSASSCATSPSGTSGGGTERASTGAFAPGGPPASRPSPARGSSRLQEM